MAATAEFRTGLDAIGEAIASARLCLMCSEREPLDCHRCLLVTRALKERGLALGHILIDGTIEPHALTEDRLLGRSASDDLFGDRTACLAQAYRARARKVAARLEV